MRACVCACVCVCVRACVLFVEMVSTDTDLTVARGATSSGYKKGCSPNKDMAFGGLETP